MRIADGIQRLGDGLINSYLLGEGTEVTIIDAGISGYWSDLPAEFAAMGRTLVDVRAIVLTHEHSDPIGFAKRARRERGVPVRVHEPDAGPGPRRGPEPGQGNRTHPTAAALPASCSCPR